MEGSHQFNQKIQKFIGKFCTPLYCSILLSLHDVHLYIYSPSRTSFFFLRIKNDNSVCLPHICLTKHLTSNVKKKKNLYEWTKRKHSIHYYDDGDMVSIYTSIRTHHTYIHPYIYIYIRCVCSRQNALTKKVIHPGSLRPFI